MRRLTRFRRLQLTRHAAVAACAALVLVGCNSDSGTAPSATTAAFDRVWRAFDETYPFFELKGVNWPAARTTYAPQAAAAGDITALNTVLVEMLAQLRDIHVSLESPQGGRTPTWTPTAARNWDSALWQTVIARAGWVQAKVNLGRGRIDGIPYMAIGSWNGSQFTTGDLDAILEEFRGDSALIIDVRPNGGGNDALALDLARRFIDAPTVTERFRFRTGPRPTDLGNEITRTITPRGPWTFTGRVYVLSGRGVFSSNESFIAAMREAPRAVIVGDTTGGATANPKPVDYYQGWKVWVSTWYATLPDGQPIEGRGIAPDVYVPWSPTATRDPVIDAAISLARAPR
ncbi:MAG: S41 family peptidase [Gemmatimonadota bacterium]